MATETALERRWRLTHRALPALGALALGALLAGLAYGSLSDSAEEGVARRYARAWTAGDYGTMHRLLTPDARARFPIAAFRAAHLRALDVATATGLSAGGPAGTRDDAVRIPIAVRTRVFGAIRGEVLLRVREEGDVAWGPDLTFPGLAAGTRLRRRSELPERATILAADGQVLAQGPAAARSSPADGVGAEIAGAVAESDDPAERRELFRRGFPKRTPVGTTGLERALQARVEGRPGGTLIAGTRVLARSRPRRAAPARSTIDPEIQAAAVEALAGRFGGIAALDAQSAEVRALAGVAFSAPQPPGSTFKLVTTTAALEAGLVKPADDFPVETGAVIDGVPLENANGESCGGSFADSFAHSCNSVFAPLGVKVGAKRLVANARRFGWNAEPSIPGALPSTLPEPQDIVSPLELGATAIGQGRVLATALAMASVSQAVANGGVRVEPTLLSAAPARRTRVSSPRTARTLTRLMVGVVDYGTGTAAAIRGVKVAGKTGTAELEDTRGPGDVGSDPSNTDAWFTAFAPAGRSKLAVAVLLIRQGSGGATAAPAAQPVLAAALD